MDAAGLERQRIRAQIQRATVGMLTTLDEHGRPAGRPMLPLLLENDPSIYFLTHQGTRKIAQLMACPNVGLTFISDTCYVALSGTASVIEDRNLVERLWNPTYRAWFPDGAGDREAAVLRVVAGRVDYWEPPQSRLVRVAQAVKAIITRRPIDTPMRTLDHL